jgi:hypothetical protein
MEIAFKKIVEKLEDIDFAFIGTANLKLQGIDIEPEDIDIISNDENLIKIAKIFGSKVYNRRGFKESDFQIESHDVHVASFEGNSLREDAFKNIIYVKKYGLKIPCMPLESDLEFYRKANRVKDKGKISLIEQKLNNKKEI